jgi:CHASE2 domain-containing sensor protein
VAAVLVLAVSAVLLPAVHLRFGAGLQETASDFLFVTRVTHPAVSTVIVGIDERSHRTLIARHGAMSQWPRTLYARAIAKLAVAGARMIRLAVLFEGARPEADLFRHPQPSARLRRLSCDEGHGPGRPRDRRPGARRWTGTPSVS